MTDFSNFNPQPKKYSAPKIPKGLKTGNREPTGELALFKEIFVERNGVCEVTGFSLDFHPNLFHHILEKENYKENGFILYKKNIIMVLFDIHFMVHNSTRAQLLAKYPKAIKIFNKREDLLIEYNNKLNQPV